MDLATSQDFSDRTSHCVGLKKLSTMTSTIEEGAFEGSPLHRDDFRLDGNFFDRKTSIRTTTADARNRIICPKETTSTNISPLLSFYDQLRTLRQNSNLSHVFEFRPDLADVGGSSDFVESNCSAASTASFDQRKLSPCRQQLRQPNSRRYPFQCFRLHCISLSEFSFCLETLEKEGGIWEIRLLSIIIIVVLFYCHLQSRSFHSLIIVDHLFTVASLALSLSPFETSGENYRSLLGSHRPEYQNSIVRILKTRVPKLPRTSWGKDLVLLSFSIEWKKPLNFLDLSHLSCKGNYCLLYSQLPANYLSLSCLMIDGDLLFALCSLICWLRSILDSSLELTLLHWAHSISLWEVRE